MRKNLSIRKRVCAVLAAALMAIAAVLTVPVRAHAVDESVLSRVRQASAEEVSSLLENASIGVHLGGLTSVYAERDFPNATIQQFDSVTDIAAALDAGRVDYALQPEFTARLFMEANPGYTYLSTPIYTFDSRFATAKGNTDLRDRINEAQAKLAAEGIVDSVYNKWFEEGDYSLDDIPVVEGGEALTFAISTSSEPSMFIQDGKPAGADIEMAMRVAYELGMRAEFFDTTFAGELAAVSSGKADVATGYARTEERASQLEFCENLFDIPWVAMCVDDEAAAPSLLDTLITNFQSTFVAEGRWKMVVSGLGVTALISAGSFILATLGGALLCWMGTRGAAARGFARAYVKVVTGIPVLVWLMLLYYVVFQGIDIPAVAVAVICFGLEAAAPLSKVFTAGLDSVDQGQTEAALAMGFSRGETFRRVVLPQAARSVWGLYSGQLTALIKGTSVVGYVAIADLTKVSDIIRSRTFQAFFPLVSTAIVYFAVIALSSWLLARAGKRLDPKRRGAERILAGIEA